MPSISTKDIREKALEFTFQWVRGKRRGSPGDFLREIEEELGWRVRHVLIDILDEARRDKTLSDPERKYLNYTLNPGGITDALTDGQGALAPHLSPLDELFQNSKRFRGSGKFIETVDFLAKFKEYSPFNNILVYTQNPSATYFATAANWRKLFGRTIRENARPLVILAPKTPVLYVYDIADTDGLPLPEKLELFSRVTGKFNPQSLDYLVKNCEQDKILVTRKAMGSLRAGSASKWSNDPPFKMRVVLRDALDDESAYAALCHELAHIYLGHVGGSREGGWPYRFDLSNEIAEIEAEAVAYIVCRRAGLETRSAEYLSNYIGDEKNVSAISRDLISRTASRIETMSRRLLKPRKKKISEPEIFD